MWIVYIIIILFSFSIADNVFAETKNVSIPFGAFNPELNTPAKVWYDPPILSINVGDTVTWTNNDKEGHTVTSGKSSGRFGWMNDDFGTPDGLFLSGRFMPTESWSYIFENPGKFSCYCTIHPWMEGVVLVTTLIPDYPHDSFGNKIEAFPVIQFTPDHSIEVDLTWDPAIVKTHEKIQFVYQFYNTASNVNLSKMKYDFVLIQNGKEIYRDNGLTQIGGDYRNFVFDEPGPVIIKFEGIDETLGPSDGRSTESSSLIKATRTTEFSLIVYENQEKTSHEQIHIKPAQRLEFYYELILIIILVPGVLFITAFIWLKKKPKQIGRISTPV